MKGENNVHQDRFGVYAPLPHDPPEIVVKKDLMSYVAELELSGLSSKSIRESLRLRCVKHRRKFVDHYRLAVGAVVAFGTCFFALVASIFITEDGQCLFAFVAVLVACLTTLALANAIAWSKRLDALDDFEQQCKPPDN